MPSATIMSGTLSRRIPLIVSAVKNESGRSTLKTTNVATIASGTP
jgi:hypothetical protein